jgi:hypothetical protein
MHGVYTHPVAWECLPASDRRKKMAFPNKYPGSCGKCGKKVPAHAGLCERVNGKFTAFHKSCGAGPVLHPYHPAAAPDEPGCATCGDPEFHDGEDCPSAALAHDRAVASRSSVLRNYRGEVVSYRNAKGTCEDAPCCGCCS